MSKLVLASAVVSMGMVGVASAAPISGTFNFSGRADFEVGGSYIDWYELDTSVNPAIAVPDTPLGDIQFTSGTGSFGAAALYDVLDFSPPASDGPYGTITDLSLATAPAGVPIAPIANFFTITEHPELSFELTFLFPGSGDPGGCTADPGDVCTPFPTSPFTITNGNGGGSGVAWEMTGNLYESGILVGTWSAAFSSQFTQDNAAELLARIEDENLPGGFRSVYNSYSATVVVSPSDTPSIPEPANLVMMGMAMTGMAFAIRRRRN